MEFNVNQLLTDIKTAVKLVIDADLDTVQGFSENQLKAIAKQSERVATGIATGKITPETKQFFLDSLKDLVTGFVQTLTGIIAVTIEKVWNAIIGVIWNTISKTIGITLAIPAQ